MVDFQTLTNYALVTPQRVRPVTNQNDLAGSFLDAVQIDIAPVIEDNPVSFKSSATWNLASRYTGNGGDLDVFQWDGTHWNRAAFGFSNGAVVVADVTRSITLAVIRIAVPEITVSARPATREVAFQFTSVAGWTHVLERTGDFASWTTVTQATPTIPEKITWTEPASEARAFFRLRLVHP
jgi:hypothetical protein